MVGDILSAWMERSKVSFITNYEQSGRKASGRMGLETEIKVLEPQHQQIVTSPYIYFLVNGRNPTSANKRMPVSVIQEWIDAKGLDLNAWAVARHIDKFGIKVPNRFNNGNLIKDTFTPQSVGELQKEIGRFYITEIKSDIQTTWQQ